MQCPFYIDHLAKARLRGSRSDKTESGLLSGLSREASTKRRSGISGISNSFHVFGLIQRPSKSPCREHTSYSFVQHIYIVILPDLRGHGKSIENNLSNFFEDSAMDIEETLNKLDVKSVHLVGCSLGV